MRLVRINQLFGKRRIFTAKSTAALLSSVLSSSNDAATALLDGNNGQVDVGRQAAVQFAFRGSGSICAKNYSSVLYAMSSPLLGAGTNRVMASIETMIDVR
jgi:hypothetical protein